MNWIAGLIVFIGFVLTALFLYWIASLVENKKDENK